MKDKLYHFAICLIASLYSTELAIGLGLGKEYGDSKAKGNYWSWADIVADISGLAIGTAIRMLIIDRYNWL